MKTERIGLFGGTFNPIHSGHIRAIEIVQKKFSLDKILIIPSYIPPHKKSDGIASPKNRLKMVKLAACSSSIFVPSSIEIEEKTKSYSIITLNKIKNLYPNAYIFFILGIDAFLEIHTWKDYEKVLDQCFFVVVSRYGYKLEDAKGILEGKYDNRMLKLPRSQKCIEKNLTSFKIFLLPILGLDITSSEVRGRIKKGGSIDGLVPEAVKNYIKNKKLYK